MPEHGSMLSKGVPVPLFFMQRNRWNASLKIFFRISGNGEQGELFSMLQYRLSVNRNMKMAGTFGTPVMFNCDTDKFAPAAKGIDRALIAWNRPFRQSFYISIRS